MAEYSKTQTPRRPERLPLTRPSKALLAECVREKRRAADALDVVGDTTGVPEAVGAVPVGGDVGAGPASQPAPARRATARLPVGGFEGQSAKSVLQRYATDAVAVLFDCVNALQDYAEEAQRIGGPKGLAVASMASKGAGMLADRIVGFTVGQKLDVNITMKSQEDVPRWEQLPPEVQAKFEEVIMQATDGVWEASPPAASASPES